MSIGLPEFDAETAKAATPERVRLAWDRFRLHYFKRTDKKFEEVGRPQVCIPARPDDDDIVLEHAVDQYEKVHAQTAVAETVLAEIDRRLRLPDQSAGYYEALHDLEAFVRAGMVEVTGG